MTGVWLQLLLFWGSDELGWHKPCPSNYFAAFCAVFFFLWPPITQHGWQTPQRFHAASPHSEIRIPPSMQAVGTAGSLFHQAFVFFCILLNINLHSIIRSGSLVSRIVTSICVIYVCRFHPRFTALALGEMKHLSPLTPVDPSSLFNQWRHKTQHHYHPSNHTQRIHSHPFALGSSSNQVEKVHK